MKGTPESARMLNCETVFNDRDGKVLARQTANLKQLYLRSEGKGGSIAGAWQVGCGLCVSLWLSFILCRINEDTRTCLAFSRLPFNSDEHTNKPTLTLSHTHTLRRIYHMQISK